jgi:hypothetical protein
MGLGWLKKKKKKKKRNESLPGKFAASFPSSSPSTPQDLKSDHGRYDPSILQHLFHFLFGRPP